MTQLLTSMPLCQKPTELQTTRVPNVHLPFQNPLFHIHFSIIIVVSQIHRIFSTNDMYSVVKTDSHKETELSTRAPKFRSLYHPIKLPST